MARKFKTRETAYRYYAKMINKGLARVKAKFPDSKLVTRWEGEFDPDDYSPEKLQKARDLWKSRAVTVDSERRAYNAAIQKLRQDYGFTFINKRNARSFFRFLDDARARGLGSLYSSEQLIGAIMSMKQERMKKSDILANIDYWQKKYVKYDEEGKIIEPDEVQPLTHMKAGSKSLARYKEKMKERIRAEKRGK